MEKILYSYDDNNPSGLNFFYKFAKEGGLKIVNVNHLEYAKDAETIIINPPSKEFHAREWIKINNYIQENENTRVLFFAPNEPECEIKEFLGNPKNVEYIATQESLMNRSIKWKTLQNLVKEVSK
jgi:hypothetical protein